MVVLCCSHARLASGGEDDACRPHELGPRGRGSNSRRVVLAAIPTDGSNGDAMVCSFLNGSSPGPVEQLHQLRRFTGVPTPRSRASQPGRTVSATVCAYTPPLVQVHLAILGFPPDKPMVPQGHSRSSRRVSDRIEALRARLGRASYD